LLPCIHPFWVFPDPNVLLIRTHPNPSPSERNNEKILFSTICTEITV
jgi:hypothetical protein